MTAVLALLLSVLRRGSANMRYLTACGGLTVMAIVPLVTYGVLPESQAPDITASATAEEATTKDLAAAAAEDITAVEMGMENTGVPGSGHPGGQTSVTSSSATVVASAAPKPTAEAPATDTSQESSLQRIAAVLSPWMPWCVVAWFVGVFVVSVWNLGGWIAAQRLKRLGTNPVAEEISRRLSTLAERSGINRSVAIMKSLMVEVPVVVGWLRPMILLPVGILTGLTHAELDAILAHELAHIRRHDYLVNLLQTVLETLFFYHPGVWWISRQIRAEREHCCDDMAVTVCGSKIDYASALAAVEAGRAAPKMVMAARKADGSTLGRIRRVLGFAGNGPRRWSSSLAGGLVTSAMIVALVTCFVVADEGTEESTSAAESEQADWSAEAAKVFPDWKTAESGRYEKADIGTAKASRLLLSKERRVYVGFPFAQPKAKYPRDKGPDDPNYRSIFSHIDIITYDEKVDLPQNVRWKFPITEWEDTDGLFVKTVDLGTGLGRRWFVRTTIPWQHQLRTELKLAGGDDPIQLLVEGLLVKDSGLNAHDMPVLDIRRTARNVVNPLAAYGDKAVTYIERQITKPNELKDLAHLLRPLALMHTDAADNLLEALYEDPITQNVAADTVIGGKPRKGIKAIYLDMLKKRRHITSVGEVCVTFNWREAVAILRDIPATPKNWWSEQEPSLTALHKLGGKPRKETKVVCLDLLKKRQYIGSVDKVCVMFNWQEAAPILRDIHATARSWNELESSFTALRNLEGRPIPEQLTRARNDLSPYNLAEAGDPIVEKARNIILNSPDRQAAALIATRLAHFSGAKVSGEIIDASNRIGKELLMRMGDDAKPVLKIVIDNFSDENTRKECQKTLDVISGKIPSDDSSDELPARTTPAGAEDDPFAKMPGTTIPSTGPKAVGEEKTAWGKPVEGVQARLRVFRDGPYRPDTVLELIADVRNEGQRDLTVARAQELCELEIDGRRYRWAGNIRVKSSWFPPGRQYKDIWIHLSDQWKCGDDPLVLKPGKHSVRVWFVGNPTEKDAGEPVRFASNFIEIVPDDELAVESLKKLGWRPMEKTNLIWDGNGRVSSIDIFAPSRDVHVTDAWLVPLKGMTELRMLSLARTHITDAGLVHLRGLTDLRELRLQNTRIGDAGLAHLSGLTKLEWLELTGTQVSNTGLMHLKGLTNLKSLFLGETQVTDEGIGNLQKALPNCKITPPAGEPATETPSAVATDAGKGNIAWGQAVEGVQVRLRADKTTWKEGTVPSFKADVRNRGTRDLYAFPGQEFFEVEVDGTWHRWGG
ncbi:MAG: M48 family metalloprotease, partial [Candidatus Nealsonbacteria bacterium]|nr:M48 family metalloprotease [Candidatus Nealsonbacteria bacterium]